MSESTVQTELTLSDPPPFHTHTYNTHTSPRLKAVFFSPPYWDELDIGGENGDDNPVEW